MRKNNYDEIRIENLEFFANHGVYPEETRLGQKFMISLTMYTDTRRAGRTDELESSTNYGEVSHFIVDFMAKHTCKLIEAAAEKLAEEGKDSSFISLYYGEDVTEDAAQAAGARFQAVCPDAEISVLSGGQPVYYYIISFE